MLSPFRNRDLDPFIGIMLLQLYHVGREGMPVDLHWLLRRIELDSSSFNSRLDLLAEHPAFTSTMGYSIMPLTVLAILQLYS